MSFERANALKAIYTFEWNEILLKKYVFYDYFCAKGQDFYDQLLSIPPGPEGSKGRRLSGAIEVACSFFVPFIFLKTRNSK